jgi:hypothetical protein
MHCRFNCKRMEWNKSKITISFRVKLTCVLPSLNRILFFIFTWNSIWNIKIKRCLLIFWELQQIRDKIQLNRSYIIAREGNENAIIQMALKDFWRVKANKKTSMAIKATKLSFSATRWNWLSRWKDEKQTHEVVFMGFWLRKCCQSWHSIVRETETWNERLASGDRFNCNRGTSSPATQAPRYYSSTIIEQKCEIWVRCLEQQLKQIYSRFDSTLLAFNLRVWCLIASPNCHSSREVVWI